jgi:DNA-binding MarR family transcriptional regulator
MKSVATLDFDHSNPCFCSLLRQASRAVTRVYDSHLRDTGIRITQYSILALLQRVGDLRQSEIAHKACLEETSVTRTLQTLMEHGWIKIEPGEDRRERIVKLTKTGANKVKSVQPAWQKAQKDLRSSISKTAWSRLFTMLPEVAQSASDT